MFPVRGLVLRGENGSAEIPQARLCCWNVTLEYARMGWGRFGAFWGECAPRLWEQSRVWGPSVLPETQEKRLWWMESIHCLGFHPWGICCQSCSPMFVGLSVLPKIQEITVVAQR